MVSILLECGVRIMFSFKFAFRLTVKCEQG